MDNPTTPSLWQAYKMRAKRPLQRGLKICERALKPRIKERDNIFENDQNLLETLRKQSRQPVHRLRFERPLERVFATQLSESAASARMALFIIVLITALTLPWAAAHFFGAPAAFADYLGPITYLQAPIMVAGFLCARFIPHSRLVDWLCLATYMESAIAVTILRAVGTHYDYHLTLMLLALGAVALLLASRVRFWIALPWILIVMAMSLSSEMLFVAHTPRDLTIINALVVFFIIAIIGGYMLEYHIRKMWLNSCVLDHESRHDGLTGLLNRPALENAIKRSLRQLHREPRCFAIAMIDIDHFKRYNDIYGHLAGNQVIASVGRILGHAARRPMDFCGRYGGEEFALMWIAKTCDAMPRLAQQLRERISQAHIEYAGQLPDQVTVSIGLYVVDADTLQTADFAPDKTMERLLSHADDLLYQAKHNGRDQVACQTHSADTTAPSPAIAVQ